MHLYRHTWNAFAWAAAIGLAISAAHAKPLKVFILAGQSNMEGPAHINTFDYIGEDPATAPLLKMMRGADGKPAVCDGVWISYLTGAGEKNLTLNGKLTAGYGSLAGVDPSKPGQKIGPEFTFGLTLDAALDEPVLIIKTAWGGKSLHTDFRSPSAGPFVLPNETREYWDKNPQGAHGVPKVEDRPKWNADKVAATGVYYRYMIEHVKKVLADPKQVVPDYDAKQGYEIAGFVWFQGFNDMVDGQVYPKHPHPDQFALYTELLTHLIRDARKDLNAPKMPFVIGVMGIGGLTYQIPSMVAFRKAMAAPADMEEFKGNVVAVHTAQYFADEIDINAMRVRVEEMRKFLETKHKDHANADGLMTPEQQKEYVGKFEADLITPEVIARHKRGASDLGYHYMGCAKIFARIGQGFAEALKPFLRPAAKPVRVLIWDEQQPEQKRAYGSSFLGETIAAHLGAQPGISVKTTNLDSPEQGVDEATLDASDVVIWWSHQKSPALTDANAERVASRVREGRLGFIALHSAHWAKPFVRLMQDRAKADALAQVPEAERASARWEYLNENPIYQGVKRDTPLTPSLTHEGGVWRLTLPQCAFPGWRPDGKPSHVTTLLPQHPIAAGLPAKWDIPQTEMYDEPFHVPTPDAVVFEERWDLGEYFRSGCVWQIGKGHVFYFRPGHETYPIYKQAEPLRVIENAVRWLGQQGK